MKLGELTFFHSNTGHHEPESQSFVFKDNNLDSIGGYKRQNLKAKEYENRVFIDFKSSERESDLSRHDMDVESADCVNKAKLGFSNRVAEAQARDFVSPLSLSSNELESFMKLPNDIELVKRSSKSPALDPLDRIGSFENSVDVYMDRSASQFEPEMVVCYRDSSYVVKDICVDEGVVKNDKVLFDNVFKDNKETKKDNIEIDALILPVATEESDQDSANQDRSKDLMHRDQDVTENHSGNVNDETVLPGDKVLMLEFDMQQLDAQEWKPFEDEGEQVSGGPKFENMIEEAVLASQTSAAVDASSGDRTLPENGNLAYVVGSSAPAACVKEECHQVGGCVCGETHSTFRPIVGATDGPVVTSQDRHGFGESSFSAVGPVSSRISYSGPVPYSGSISLRSDSSTTSTRSFAFPILQNEWNSSPVRMAKVAKVEKRKYRERCGWRHGLLCCRF